jgi:DNA polymerase I-like protein with 3'-5' exonuclease and polymerase domains
MFGKEIRSLFGCYDGNYQIGYDFSGLEARVEGHFTKQFKGGDEYAKMLVAEKPNDIHTVMAKLNGITRDEQKSLKYALTYGAQVPKVAKMLGWSMDHAQKVYDSFWENASPLKDLKDRVTRYWKVKGGGKFIRGIDGRKLWIRSEHSILNMLFQSTGVICAKKANEFHWKELKARGLLFDPFWDDSLKGKAFIQIHYHDEAQWEVSPELVEIVQFESEEEREDFIKQYGKPVGDNTEHEGKPAIFYSIVGELAKKAAQDASKYYNLRVNLDADYIVGKNWAECH